MAPALLYGRQAGPVLENPKTTSDWNWRSVAKPEDLVLESWSQGFVVGALMLMGCITIANMRRGVLLHKLIFLEQAMALTHGTFCFMDFKGYGWYLSSTAALLYLSYILHNVVAWLKVRPFFQGKSTIFQPRFVKWTTRIYICSLCATVPAILFQITDNFRFFNNYGGWYVEVRPYEPLMRDPWWVFCCGVLFYVISKSYGMGVMKIIKKSPRFGILFVAIILALVFTALDIVASIHSFIGSTDGINPFWKLSLVFKCLTDAILLDDFKTELKRLGLKRMRRDEKRRDSHALVLDDDDRLDSDDEAAAHYSNGKVAYPNGPLNGFAQYRPSVATHNTQKSSDMEEPEEVEFMHVLHSHPSQLSSDRESRRSSTQRARVCRGGAPGTKLPRLFAAIKPGKKNERSSVKEARNHKENDFWAEKEQNLSTPEVVSMTKRTKKKFRDDDQIAPHEITYEDDSLERARLEQQRTIEELKRRKDSAATNKKDSFSTSPDAIERMREQKQKRAASKDFWHGIDDLDDEQDGPSRSYS